MGYRAETMTISARLSSHNDERDDEAHELWEQLQREVSELANSPRFADISPTIT